MASNSTAPGNSRKKILVCGRRGRGKSSLCNLLLESESWVGNHFPVSHSGTSTATNLTPGLNKQFEILDTTGYDGTVTASTVIREIQQIISHRESIQGVLFVLPYARLDDWDKLVFVTVLEVILQGVPPSMIGAVFTRSAQRDVGANEGLDYLRSHELGTPERIFLEAVFAKCGNNVCFIDNADKSTEAFIDTTPLRRKSLQNLNAMVAKFTGSYAYEGVLQALRNASMLYGTLVKENKFTIATSVLSVGVGIFAALAGAGKKP